MQHYVNRSSIPKKVCQGPFWYAAVAKPQPNSGNALPPSNTHYGTSTLLLYSPAVTNLKPKTTESLFLLLPRVVPLWAAYLVRFRDGPRKSHPKVDFRNVVNPKVDFGTLPLIKPVFSSLSSENLSDPRFEESRSEFRCNRPTPRWGTVESARQTALARKARHFRVIRRIPPAGGQAKPAHAGPLGRERQKSGRIRFGNRKYQKFSGNFARLLQTSLGANCSEPL